jgi:catechol 2,3-dioxygenase-like lactoylglutathione lyase family enzyme
MIVYPVKWYQEVFGFNVINGPVEIVVDDSPLGVILKDIHGPNLNKMRIEELCKKNSESGGKQRSKIWDLVPNKGYKIVFCEDPFGNVIEIYTHGYEQTITSV